MDVIVDAIVAFLKEIGVDSEELDDFEEQRQQAKEEVKKYNEENNTDYTLTEYNEKVNKNTKDSVL